MIRVLEASAGTGKTHAVTTEVVRALVDGVGFDQMLLVTFTTKATSELRDRVWRRLASVVAALRDETATDDELVHELRAEGPHAVATHVAALTDAQADFDAATIATIHAFCQQVLRTVGIAADVDRDATLVGDDRELREEVVDDLLVQRLHRRPDVDLPRDRARRIAEVVTTNPTAPLLPEGVDRRSPEGLPVSFGTAVRTRVEQRKRHRRELGYDDLLARVAEALLDDRRGVRRRLRERFRLVVVDEFQDTDALQWQILRDAFDTEGIDVVLVGDPKQAIYAFRGADVHAYLAAAATQTPEALTRNWRSDADLLDALDLLLDGVDLGDPDIAYRPVTAAPPNAARRLVGGRRPAPLRLRLVPRGTPLRTTRDGVQRDAAIDVIARDLAADVVRTLEDGTAIVRTHGPDAGQITPVRPGDIAVLVHRNADALVVRDALAALAVPAVVNGAGSVQGSPAADDWIVLLDAIDRPADRTRAAAAALTPLLGWRAGDLDGATDADWDHLHAVLHGWRAVLADHGVAALFTRVGQTLGRDGLRLAERLLAGPGGDRALTDLRHLVQLVDEATRDVGRAPSTLAAWCRARRRESADDVALDERSRRLDTDADAVQVWTVHRAKGQEFPIVHVPFLWQEAKPPEDPPFVFHDPTRGERVLDVGGGRDTTEHRRLADAEALAEGRRVAYVALTRARHQIVLWWVPSWMAHRSALARLLFARDGTPLDDCPSDDDARRAALVLAQPSGGAIGVEDVPVPVPEMLPWTGGVRTDPDQLSAARFARRIDHRWRRTSYSALTRAAHDGGATGSEPAAAPEHDETGLEDEWMPDDAATGAGGDPDLAARLRAVPSRFGDLRGGARLGTLVHEVLEHTDFAAPDLSAEVAAALAGRWLGGLEDLDRATLVDGVVASIETPLGPLVDGLALRDLDRADRLDELHFELPLVGGDEPAGDALVTMAAIAETVSAHLGDDAVVGDYGAQLADPLLATEVRGYLSGSIDVVVRHDGRYLVVDHKTNRLDLDGEPLSCWHYRPEALASAMVRSHYPLQALLYQVALHRYLRWRLPDHDPERDLGGVLYLFLRGMTGPDVPLVDGAPCGVFSWQPPAALVVALSDLFDHGAGGRRP